ncbi:RNA recognition motif domain-containing protein [Ditylenchus destructor]|uniref:RNA recognition motif domain-containing protein n=1 Tax=Ditylenchus destructor TaxID=166010 RepID=A0AAD4R325_9BILA|nr:RNA recognition motif domain-containing protein [Ditylenchus destructor]
MGYSSRDSERDSRDNGRERDRPAAYRSGNDRLARSYRSPPPAVTSNRISSREVGRTVRDMDERRSRRDGSPGGSECLSAFYRDRFGDHSPEDYLNLRMSQFDKGLSKDSIRSILEKEFKHMAPFEIKIVNNPEDNERLAYVNFERPDCAKTVRRSMVSRLQKVLGRRIMLDPAGVIRDQEGKYIPDRYNRAAMAAAERERSPGPRGSRVGRRSPPSTTRVGNFSGNSAFGKRKDGQFTNLNQDDGQASRTLFVGNLPGDVRETELKRVFEVYGTVEDIDIKILADSNAAYAFILFHTVEESIDARRTQHNKPMRPGSTKCQIGYGKSQVSPRLYVGSLGQWVTADMLMKEFDRYGPIESIEYEDGDSCAYIRFEDSDSASDACARMKNFDLGGKGECITVDFAKDDKKDKSRKRGRSSSDDEYGDGKRGRGPRTPSVSPQRSPTEAGYINTVEELKDQVASTWKGLVLLKKTEYPLSLYRVFGKEHLLQDIMRDESGNALKLVISQRLPLDNNFYQKMIDFNQRELALMVAIEGSTSAEPLVKYLQEKNAAGVITVNGGVVYVLAASQVADRMFKFFAPRIAVIKPGTNHLLVALKKTSPGQNPVNSAPPAMTNTNHSMNSSHNSSNAALAPPPPAPMIPEVRVKKEPGLPPTGPRPSALLEKDYKPPTSGNGTIKKEPSDERDDEEEEETEDEEEEAESGEDKAPESKDESEDEEVESDK